jgi:hypothetical protein
MARATKAKTRGKARTRHTSPEVERSGSEEPQGHFVAERKPVHQEPQNETAKPMKPAQPSLEEELREYLRYQDGDPSFCKIYEVLLQYLEADLPPSFARTTAIRKLVESKDAALRIRKLYTKRNEDMAWVVKYVPPEKKGEMGALVLEDTPYGKSGTKVSIDKQFAVAK